MRASHLWFLAVLGVVLAPILAAPARAQGSGIRDVSATDRSLIPLQTRLRYTTMIVLPDDEQILDVICGDKDYWIVSATHNIAHVKPAKDGAATNLNLVTDQGNIYSFLLTEKSGAGTPDLKVYVAADEAVARVKPKYVTAEQVAQVETQLTQARAALDAAQRRASETIAAYRQEYPTRLEFPFAPLKYEKPFYVRAIWHDDAFTYIRSDATELPALYEMKDGSPSLLNFQVQNGTYVIPKLLDNGYLALGKERVSFVRQGR